MTAPDTLQWNWHETPGDNVSCALSTCGHYVISHRPKQYTVSYRPPQQHIHVGTFDRLDKAKVAAILYHELKVIGALT